MSLWILALLAQDLTTGTGAKVAADTAAASFTVW
jgi:hypothetical protein